MRRPILPLLILALGLTLLTGCGGSKPSEEVKLGGIALTDVLDGLIKRTSNALQSITDGPSAQAANETLKMINDDFDDLAYHVPKLPPSGREELAKHAQKRFPDLEQLNGMVMRQPQLASILGEQMGLMMVKMGALTSPNAGQELQ